MGEMKRGKGSGSVGVIYSGPEKKKVSYCEICMSVGVVSPLNNRVYLDEEGNVSTPASDSDKWRQCWRCGDIVAIYEVEQQSEISTAIEASDNPFDRTNGGAVVAVEQTRKFDNTKTGRRRQHKRLRKKLDNIKDENLRTELKKGAKLISYQSSDGKI